MYHVSALGRVDELMINVHFFIIIIINGMVRRSAKPTTILSDINYSECTAYL